MIVVFDAKICSKKSNFADKQAKKLKQIDCKKCPFFAKNEGNFTVIQVIQSCAIFHFQMAKNRIDKPFFGIFRHICKEKQAVRKLPVTGCVRGDLSSRPKEKSNRLYKRLLFGTNIDNGFVIISVIRFYRFYLRCNLLLYDISQQVLSDVQLV